MLINFFKYFFILTGLCAMLSFGYNASAYVRSSSNFRIQSDSVNSGGTDESSSDSYKAWDTVGEIGTGISSSTNYGISAGYRQLEENYIAMTISSSSIMLTPALSGLAGGTASSSAMWTVTTDSIPGYRLDIKATGSPAMKSGANSFADYTPASAGTPDYDWNLAGANSEFGFSPYNASNQLTRFNNDGGSCNAGTGNTDGKCWYGLASSGTQAVYRTTRTDTGGEAAKINFRAEIKTSGGSQEAGEYRAVIVVTAVAN